MRVKSIARARFLIAAAAAVLGILSATPGHAAVVTMTFSGTYDSSAALRLISTGLHHLLGPPSGGLFV
jgi:hypothetical protein